MSTEIQKIEILQQPRGSMQVTYLPNCPNPEFLPNPIVRRIQAGQYWYNHLTSMVFKIERIVGVVGVSIIAVVDDLIHTPARIKKEISISKFLEEYSMVLELTAIDKIKKKKTICRNDNVLNHIL